MPKLQTIPSEIRPARHIVRFTRDELTNILHKHAVAKFGVPDGRKVVSGLDYRHSDEGVTLIIDEEPAA